MDIFLRYLFWFFPFFFVPLHLILKVNVILFEPTMDELADIRNKIYEIRSQRVMLDRDIAVFYGYLPHAIYTFWGSMLSSVLESDSAIEANRRIMRAFVTFHQLKSLSFV